MSSQLTHYPQSLLAVYQTTDGDNRARRGAPRGGIATKKVDQPLSRRSTEPTMDSKMAAQLEVDLAQSASFEQTEGVVNGAKGVCA